MTAFKIVTNQTTGRNTYYLDCVRVSKEKFYNIEKLCQIKGMNYNSSVSLRHKNRIYDFYHYN